MKEKIKADIITDNVNIFTSKWVVERIPHIFDNNLQLYIEWKEQLSVLIGVDSKAITITGSAAVGVSLNPEKNFQDFNQYSDIDVAIISGLHFDICWHHLRNIGTKRYKLSHKEKVALDDHRTRLIYWGTIATDKIVQILPFGIDWLKAMDQMKKSNPTKDRTINFRIYKDFEALRAYQNQSVSKVKDLLLQTSYNEQISSNNT